MFLYMSIMTACTIWSVLAARFVIHAEEQTSSSGHLLSLLACMADCSLNTKSQNCQKTNNNDENQQQPNHLECNQDSMSLNDNLNGDTSKGKMAHTQWNQVIVCLDKSFFCLLLVVYIVGTLAFLL